MLYFSELLNYIQKNILPNLNYDDFNKISNLYEKLLNYIYIKICSNISENDFIKKLKENEYSDAISIFNLLLPYIDDKNGSFELHKKIRNLQDISCLKKDDDYIISNVQYDRCYLYNENNKLMSDEYKYSYNDIKMNYELLLNSLDIISNKLYLNWNFMIPINLNEYKKSNLFINSFYFNEKNELIYYLKNDEKLIDTYFNNYKEIRFKYNGLYFKDYYDTVYHDLYLDIYKIKWVIKEINEIPYISIISKYLNLKNIYDNEYWLLLENDIKNEFIKDINNMIIIFYNDNHYIKILIDIIKNIELNKEMMKILKNKYNYQEIMFDYKSEKSNKSLNYFKENNLLLNEINKIPMDIFYNYFYNILHKFYKTWYGKKMINFIKNNLFIIKKYNDITFFKLYLYSKNVLYIDKNNKIMFSHYDTLDNSYENNERKLLIKIFIDNLSTNDNLLNDKKFKYKNNENIHIFKQITTIYLSNFRNIVFECLIYKGLLMKCIYHKNIFDVNNKIYLNNLKNNIFINDIDNFKNNSYYFLTNDKYDKLIINKKNFIDLLYTEYIWTKDYGINWIFQINFYHHYINNRVSYITGPTGQGKSTLIPKLYLYGLYMVNRKYDGKVLITLPRIKVTLSNSNFVSYQLGVPINKYDENYDTQLRTNNGYIQYKMREGEHIISNNDFYILNTTDGSLYNDLIESPLLKDKYNKNLYDIIVIDESHEHNKNMDLLLTLLRHTIYYNNSIKLGIVSATMDNDEKIYRRFYRHINDNYLYPLNLKLINDKLDRICVDRKIHLAPPRLTTRFNIIEHYLEYEPKDYDEAEIAGIEQLFKIIKSGFKGDILFFSIGDTKIKKLVNVINKRLDNNSEFIAYPMYRKLKNKWSNKIDNISDEIKSLDIYKNDLMNYIDDKIDNPKKIIKGTYKYYILVATNIVEASFTFETLKLVIDTGYFYDIITSCNPEDNKVEPKKITDSSRKQRKGRVGRVSDGIVYYMYKENSRLYSEPKYEITSVNISNELYKMLKSNYKKYFEKIDEDINIIDINIIDKKYKKNIKTNKYEINEFRLIKNKKIINEIYITQYFYILNNKKINLNYKYFQHQLEEDYLKELRFKKNKNN